MAGVFHGIKSLSDLFPLKLGSISRSYDRVHEQGGHMSLPPPFYGGTVEQRYFFCVSVCVCVCVCVCVSECGFLQSPTAELSLWVLTLRNIQSHFIPRLFSLASIS